MTINAGTANSTILCSCLTTTSMSLHFAHIVYVIKCELLTVGNELKSTTEQQTSGGNLLAYQYMVMVICPAVIYLML